MILPTKYIPADQALIGIGGLLLKYLDSAMTVSGLWEKVRENPSVGTFERFTLCLVMLYTIGVIQMTNGMLERAPQ